MIRPAPRTPTPPMGWNSFDCFAPAVPEEEGKGVAEAMADRLRGNGWQYVAIDARWYDPAREAWESPREVPHDAAVGLPMPVDSRRRLAEPGRPDAVAGDERGGPPRQPGRPARSRTVRGRRPRSVDVRRSAARRALPGPAQPGTRGRRLGGPLRGPGAARSLPGARPVATSRPGRLRAAVLRRPGASCLRTVPGRPG